MSFAEADALPEYMELKQPQIFQKDGIVDTIMPEQLQPNPGILPRDAIVVLSLIRDAYPTRGIFFSSGGYGRQLGLAKYSLRTGLVEKLVDHPIVANKDTVQVGDGWLDVPTSARLWTEVYKAPKELIEEGHWIDRPSFGIPYTYTVTGYVLADALMARGDTARAQAIMKEVRGVAAAARLTDVLAGMDKP
jgi:hypothetical protein